MNPGLGPLTGNHQLDGLYSGPSISHTVHLSRQQEKANGDVFLLPAGGVHRGGDVSAAAGDGCGLHLPHEAN